MEEEKGILLRTFEELGFTKEFTYDKDGNISEIRFINEDMYLQVVFDINENELCISGLNELKYNATYIGCDTLGAIVNFWINSGLMNANIN